MNLVNSEGSAIFGPGSEWFWSMAQFIVVVVTLFGIYRQLRIARSANAFEQMNRITDDWESERTTRHTLEIYLALREGVDLENIPEGAATFLINFLENVAALVRAGHVDRRLVYENFGKGASGGGWRLPRIHVALGWKPRTRRLASTSSGLWASWPSWTGRRG